MANPTAETVIPADKEDRHAWMAAILRASIAGQIRGLRQSRRLSQQDLAGALRTTQSAIARLEDPEGPWMSVETLLRIARYFDVALRINFAGWREFMEAHCKGEGLPEVPSHFTQEHIENITGGVDEQS